MSEICPDGIPSNPDIAGIGVRLSLYIQAITLCVPYILAHSYKLSLHEPEPERVQSFLSAVYTLIITGCSLAISAFVQVKNGGLTVYHAFIVLDLCWLVIIALYLCVDTNVIPMVREKPALLQLVQNSTQVIAPGLHRNVGGRIWGNVLRLPARDKTWLKYGRRLFALLMCSLGFWLFSNPSAFDMTNPGCTEITVQWFYGRKYLAITAGLRKFWIVMYSFSVIFEIGMSTFWIVIIVTTFCERFSISFAGDLLKCAYVMVVYLSSIILGFLSFCFGCFCCIPALIFACVVSITNKIVSPFFRPPEEGLAAWLKAHFLSIFDLLSFLTLLFLPVSIITSIEMTIKSNNVQPGEDKWTFGQTIALLLVIPGVWSTLLDIRTGIRTYKERQDMPLFIISPLRQPDPVELSVQEDIRFHPSKWASLPDPTAQRSLWDRFVAKVNSRLPVRWRFGTDEANVTKDSASESSDTDDEKEKGPALQQQSADLERELQSNPVATAEKPEESDHSEDKSYAAKIEDVA